MKVKGKNVRLHGSRGVSAEGKQVAAEGDKVLGFDVHQMEVPSANGTQVVPLPHPFMGKLKDKLAKDVRLGNRKCAVKGSVAKHDDAAHMQLPGTIKFQQSPKKEGEVTGGTSTKVKIDGKDANGNDDDVTSLTTKVQDGKIKCKWKVVYMEDDDDADSEQEKEEKGYTLPEYAFTVECGGTESEESAQLEITGGLRIQLKDKKSNTALKNIKISLMQNDSIYKTLTTDEEGYFELLEIPIGKYEIVLEN